MEKPQYPPDDTESLSTDPIAFLNYVDTMYSFHCYSMCQVLRVFGYMPVIGLKILKDVSSLGRR